MVGMEDCFVDGIVIRKRVEVWRPQPVSAKRAAPDWARRGHTLVKRYIIWGLQHSWQDRLGYARSLAMCESTSPNQTSVSLGAASFW